MNTSPPAGERDFDHVLLTRFSVRFTGFPPHTDDWLFYRWAFFRDALASALAQQTERDFEWLVFFDIDTPDWLRVEIEELSVDLFQPRYVPNWSREVAQAAVQEISSSPYLITTRIDSDDAVAAHFIADIQSHFERQSSLYINLLCGIQVERTGEVYRYDEPTNPFLSYVEKRVESTPPRTVFFDLRHVTCRQFADVLNVVGPPRWAQIIHGTNLANGVRGLRARPEPFEDFRFELPFDRTVSQARYRRERARSVVDLVRFWVLYPYYAWEYVSARRLRRAGTQILPQLDSAPTSNAIYGAIRDVTSPLRAGLRTVDRAWRRRRNRQRPVSESDRGV